MENEKFYDYMQFEKCASRGEVPCYDEMIRGLKHQFGTSIIKQNLRAINNYYRYMVICEYLDYRLWRIERYGSDF